MHPEPRYYDAVSPVGPANNEPPPKSHEPSPRERLDRILVIAKRAFGFWKGSALIFFALSGIALLVAMNVKRIYRSEVVVLIKPVMRTDEREESPTERAMKLAPKLKDTLLTRSRLEPIIKEFHLYPKTVESKGIVDAVEEMRAHTGFRGRDSETFVISFEDEDQDRTRAITQRLADTMMQEYSKSNVTASKQEAEFLSAEEKRVEDELETASRNLATFLASHPEFAADTQTGAFGPRPAASGGPAVGGSFVPPGAPSPAFRGDAQLAALYRQKSRLEAELRSGPTAAPAGGNETVGSLTKARDEAAKRAAQAQAELADRRTKYTDQHPDVIAAKGQAEAAARSLKVAQDQLDQAKGQPVGDSPANNAELQRKLDEIGAAINVRQAELSRGGPAAAGAAASPTAAEPQSPLVALETDWQRLLRSLSDAKASHDDLGRQAERAKLHASATEATAGDQMEILDPAYRPIHPTRGGRTNTALTGFGLALFFALAVAFLRVLLSDTLLDAADVDALGLVPVLGAIPRVRAPSHRAKPIVPPPTARPDVVPASIEGSHV